MITRHRDSESEDDVFRVTTGRETKEPAIRVHLELYFWSRNPDTSDCRTRRLKPKRGRRGEGVPAKTAAYSIHRGALGGLGALRISGETADYILKWMLTSTFCADRIRNWIYQSSLVAT